MTTPYRVGGVGFKSVDNTRLVSSFSLVSITPDISKEKSYMNPKNLFPFLMTAVIKAGQLVSCSSLMMKTVLYVNFLLEVIRNISPSICSVHISNKNLLYFSGLQIYL